MPNRSDASSTSRRAVREVQAQPAGATEDDVLGHGHGPHEREVLRDHAHAGGDGVARGVDGHRPAVDARSSPASARLRP